MNFQDILSILTKFLSSPFAYLIFVILLALSQTKVKELIGDIGGVLQPAISESQKISAHAQDTIQRSKEGAVSASNKTFLAMEAVLKKLVYTLNNACSGLVFGIKHLIKQLTPDSELAGWRMLGAMVELTALALLVFADASISANNYVAIDPNAKIPDFLKGLSIPMLMASTGGALIMGMITGDFLGLSHFGLWKQTKGIAKAGIVITVLITFLLIMILSLGQGLSRIETLTVLTDEFRASIRFWGAVAQSVLIIPLLITTFFIFRGLGGIFVILIIIFGGLWLILQIFRLIVELFSIALGLGGISAATVIKLLGILLAFSFFVITHFFISLGGGFTALVSAFQATVEVLTSPVFKIWGKTETWVGPIIRKKFGLDDILNFPDDKISPKI